LSKFILSMVVFLLLALALAILLYLGTRLLSGKKIQFSRNSFLLLVLIPLAIGIILLAVGWFLEFHEQPSFCGDLMCHSMEPHFEAYEHPANNTFMEVHAGHHVTCVDCHSEPGLKGQLKSYAAVPNEMWGEFVVGYNDTYLHGHVPSETCLKGCHEEYEMDWRFEAPEAKGAHQTIENGTWVWPTRLIEHPMVTNGDVEELSELETCKECHDPRSNSIGLGSQACPVCHDVTSEELERHGNDTCAFSPCHASEPGETVLKIGHRDVPGHCMECHDRDHPEDAAVPYAATLAKGVFAADNDFCGSCHETTKQEFDLGAGKHGQTLFCGDCHDSHKDRPECMDCHETLGVAHSVASPYDDCQACHVKGGHEPKLVNFVRFDSTQLSTSFCGNGSCHGADVYADVQNNLTGKLHDTMAFSTDCVACHPVHEERVDCYDCHSGQDSPGHDIAYPFSDCTSCHDDGHEPDAITFAGFASAYGLNNTFCEGCHVSPGQELQAADSSHAGFDCFSCHDRHTNYVDCLACHSPLGNATQPLHFINAQYAECTGCHYSGHDPMNIFFTEIQVDNDFCGGCHEVDGAGMDAYFESYAGGHADVVDGCANGDCHGTHDGVNDCTACHIIGIFPADHSGAESECMDCHDSAHNPYFIAPRPGGTLSQRDYMTEYYTLDPVDTTQNFAWNIRGSHDEYGYCGGCHLSPYDPVYPMNLTLMSAPGQDCAGSCHNWTRISGIRAPYSLLSNTNTNHSNIFNNATYGGCAGVCHQLDPLNPVYDGSGHGTVTNCLEGSCHGTDFLYAGSSHQQHVAMLDDAGMECFELCHGSNSNDGAPIDGGCYNCHKSGHDPKLLSISACYGAGCHT